MRHSVSCVVALLALISGLGFAQEASRYMGVAVELVEAPNGAVVDANLPRSIRGSCTWSRPWKRSSRACGP